MISPSEKTLIKKRVAKTLIILLIIGVLVTAAAIFLHKFVPFSICPFRNLTGLYCPGCGMTGAFISLLKLDIEASLKNNAFFIPSLLFVLYTAAVTSVNYIKTGKYALIVKPKWLPVVFLILLLAWSIGRNVILIFFK